VPFEGGDATDFLDLGPGHGLVVRDDGQRLEGGPRKLLGLDHVPGEHEGEVVRGAKAPAARDLHEVHAARRVEGDEISQHGLDIRPFRQSAPNVLRRERLCGSEKHGLGDAHGLA
jgi:hypothetical protein